MKHKLIVISALSLSISACGQNFQTKTQGSIASDLTNRLACKDSRAEVFEAYYKAYENSSDLSQGSFKKDILAQSEKNQKLSAASPAVRSKLQTSAETIHRIFTEGLQATKVAQKAKQDSQKTDDPNDYQPEDESDDLLHLARLEMRSEIDPQYASLNAKLDAALVDAQGAAKELGISCEPAPAPIAQEDLSTSALDSNDPLYGAWWTMATAYQSCSSLELAPVSSSTASTQGVVKSKKVDSVGWGRAYSEKDLPTVKRTHYYHRGVTYGPSCANQDKKPMVYDYGGQSVYSSSKNTLDMHTNSGGGTALGIDCSAFVSAAAAVAGNKYNSSTSKTPVYKRFASRDFINPTTSGWSCYDSVTVNATSSIRPGDIASVKGHVVMVDEVGTDPFGLSKIKSATACSSITYRNFDFVVIQSSPSKGSIGINRYEAKDYLSESTKMANMFVGYAKQACKSKFDNVARKPVTSEYGIIRHKQTSTCLAPRVKLVNESCIENCSILRL